MKIRTLKIIGTTWLVNICIYAISYLAISFANWNFQNPFRWIIDLPTYQVQIRATILLGISVWWISLYQIILMMVKEKEEKKASYSDIDVKHLELIYARMEERHNENPNVDYMHTLKNIIKKLKEKK